MKRLPLCWLLLAGLAAQAQTLYVTDKLEVGVYAQPSLEGDRIAVLRSADAVELVSREGEAAMVRLSDGTEGWVAGSYLEVEVPSAGQLEALTAENERLRASTRADAAAGAEVKTLKERNAQLQSELASAQRDLDALQARGAAPISRPEDEIPVETARPADSARLLATLGIIASGAATLALGFWWGYRTLERRVRRKYGGLKVY